MTQKNPVSPRGTVALDNFPLPGTVAEKDEFLENLVSVKGLELEEVKPIKLRESNDGEAVKEVLPTNHKIWLDFITNTSLHGIRYVFCRRPLWARVGWLLILMAFSQYFLFTAYKSLEKYFNYPINTVITQKYVNEMDFPAVSICPLNFVSKKKMLAMDGKLNVSNCDCPVPCNEIRYTTELHYSKFPDAGSAAALQADGVRATFKYLRENMVFHMINYKTLSYELHEQKEEFGNEALFGEIGGNMGLFLGCSLMTVFEFADFLVALVYVRAFHEEYQLN